MPEVEESALLTRTPPKALLLAQTATATYNVQLGMGQHIYQLNPAHSYELLMVSDVSTVFAVMAVALSKASAGISLLRLLQKWWQRLVVQLIIVTTVLAMAGIAVSSPLRAGHSIPC